MDDYKITWNKNVFTKLQIYKLYDNVSYIIIKDLIAKRLNGYSLIYNKLLTTLLY